MILLVIASETAKAGLASCQLRSSVSQCYHLLLGEKCLGA